MNTFRQVRLKYEIDQLFALRQRILKLRDDEDRALRSGTGGSQKASDLLSEIHLVLLVAMDKLEKVKTCGN